MIGSHVIVKMLEAYGVTHVFGVPGDTSISFYEALHDRRDRIRHIMARDERAAAFMADAYARLSHKPGICECPSGAGSLYTVPGVAEANASGIPLIAITSDIPLAGEGRQTITELDTQGLYASITKWAAQVKHVDKLPEMLRRAFRIAVSGRPGAVHLAVPQEALKGRFSIDPSHIYAEPQCRTYPAFRTRGARKELETLVSVLLEGRRRVIIAGGGANHSQAGTAIQSLAEWLCAPVVSTISGQGILPDDHPLAMGVIGDNGFHPHAHLAVEEADTTPITPLQVISQLNRHLHDPAVVIADAGTPTPYITRYLRLATPGSRFIIPRAYGGLGYAIPAVIGAHFARPDVKLAALFGDGSLGMSAGDLETISRLNIPAVLIHFNNAAFGWIKALQKLHCKEKYYSVDFNANDPVKVAEGFGLNAISVNTPRDLEAAFKQAFEDRSPVFLDIKTRPESDDLPPVYSWTAGQTPP